MTEPTQEQIKEFWEWCGIIIDKYGNHELPDDGKPLEDRLIFPPLSIDLNNLFKYAVPKLERVKRLEVLMGWAFEIYPLGELGIDPALALFWALRQVK